MPGLCAEKQLPSVAQHIHSKVWVWVFLIRGPSLRGALLKTCFHYTAEKQNEALIL